MGVYENLKAAGFKPTANEAIDDSMPQLKGDYVISVEDCTRIVGENDKGPYDFWSLRARIVKTLGDAQEGKNRWIKDMFTCIDNKFKKAEDEQARFTRALMTILKEDIDVSEDGVTKAAEKCIKKLAIAHIVPKRVQDDEGKWGVKYDDNGNPEHKFTIVSGIKKNGKIEKVDLSEIEKKASTEEAPF